MRNINVCLSPALYEFYAKDDSVVVMIDAIRASASICTAFHSQVELIIPVSDVETARSYKEKGFLIAGERDGYKIEGFDFGNSPFNFTEDTIKNKKLAFTTTNGTQVINKVINGTQRNVNLIIGSFINISALKEYLLHQEKNVLILCSGWKNSVNIEDTLFAGRLAYLLKGKSFELSESANLAIQIYLASGNSYYDFILNNSPRLKEKSEFLEADFKYCLSENLTTVVPFFNKGILTC